MKFLFYSKLETFAKCKQSLASPPHQKVVIKYRKKGADSKGSKSPGSGTFVKQKNLINLIAEQKISVPRDIASAHKNKLQSSCSFENPSNVFSPKERSRPSLVYPKALKIARPLELTSAAIRERYIKSARKDHLSS